MSVRYSAKILSVTKETETIYTFVIEKSTEFKFSPGQYVWVSIKGYPKSPMAIASGIFDDHILLSVRKWGELTTALFQLQAGDYLTVDGPYGTYFPMEELKKSNKLFLVAGGTGITPIRSLIRSTNYLDQMTLFYGAQESKQLLFLEELTNSNIRLNVTIDKPEEGWQGKTGYVIELLEAEQFSDKTQFFICGPFPMLKGLSDFLISKKLPKSQIFVSIEKFDKDGNVVGPVLTLDDPLSGFA